MADLDVVCALGAPLALAIGSLADFVAAAAVIGIGAWMLLHAEEGDEHEKAGQLASTHGAALIGLGASISLDELAIGFSLGLAEAASASTTSHHVKPGLVGMRFVAVDGSVAVVAARLSEGERGGVGR